MAQRERGFMGEKFPSKKFRQVMAKFLGHDDPIIRPSTDIRDQFNIAGDTKPTGEVIRPTINLDTKPLIIDVPNMEVGEVRFVGIPIPEPIPIPGPDLVEEYAQRVREAAARNKVMQMQVLTPYMDMVENYKRELEMAEIQLKNSIPERSPSYDEVLEENKALKAKCEALEEREQVIIDAIIECFGRRPVIIDDTIQLAGVSYNEMVRTINKVRITE
jgi:hypothetical protein